MFPPVGRADSQVSAIILLVRFPITRWDIDRKMVKGTSGPVVQLVRTLACHARGQGFESPSGRHLLFLERKSKQNELSISCGEHFDRCSLSMMKKSNILAIYFASVAQLVEQRTENPRVVGSIPTGGTTCGFSSFGRARPCQGRGGGFEPRNPLQLKKEEMQISSFLFGSIAQLGEHLPYKQRVIGSSPIVSTSRQSRQPSIGDHPFDLLSITR